VRRTCALSSAVASTSTIVALLVTLLLTTGITCVSARSAGGGLPIISASGEINKSAAPIPSSPRGVIAILTSPGRDDPYFSLAGADAVTALPSGDGGSPVILTAPGATLAGGVDAHSLHCGSGAAAAAAIAGSVILTGVTGGDVQGTAGLGSTRHGRTLSAVFTNRLARYKPGDDAAADSSADEKTLLIIAVTGEDHADTDDIDIDESEVESSIRDMFVECAVSVGARVEFDDLFEVEVVSVDSEADAAKVMNMATDAASRSSLASSNGSVTSALTDIYSHITGSGHAADPPIVTEVLLGCDDAYARHYRSARAKLAAWKSRTARGLTVDRFGGMAQDLLKRTVELYDRDTMVAAGLPNAAPYRLEMRSKLIGRIEKPVREIFEAQVANLQRRTQKRFESALLRRLGKNPEGTENFYNSNADALRNVALAFEVAMDNLEVPSLSLTKAIPVQEMTGKLNSALVGFPDTPAARMRQLSEVKAAASREKQPTQRSIDFGLDFVGMIRPDGYGSLQGFAGYQLGGNQIIVGVCNDADSPEVISQFGGVRPPFIRVQPKLKLDVEL